MSVVPVADVLQGRVAVDQEVTVRGWVRTRRDSKAGISFLAVYDGSCFDPVQAVEMFRVSTLDLENLPRNDQGRVDFDKDFLAKNHS